MVVPNSASIQVLLASAHQRIQVQYEVLHKAQPGQERKDARRDLILLEWERQDLLQKVLERDID